MTSIQFSEISFPICLSSFCLPNYWFNMSAPPSQPFSQHPWEFSPLEMFSLESIIHHGIMYSAVDIYKAVLSCCTSWSVQIISLTSFTEQCCLLWMVKIYYVQRQMCTHGWEDRLCRGASLEFLVLESSSQVLAFCRAIKCVCDVKTINGQMIEILSLSVFF